VISLPAGVDLRAPNSRATVGRRIAVWLLSLSFYLGPLPASAQLAPGEIVVTVTDAATKAPIADAAVIFLGGIAPESSFTDQDGKVTFLNRQAGSYAIEVKKDDYDTYDLSDVEVGPNQHVAIAVALKSSSALKTIAIVTAKASSSITSTEIGADSAERKVSISLKNALSKLAGVSVDDSTYGPNSGIGVSLLNQDVSQTGYAINGIRISGPGGGDLGSSAAFTGASVTFTPTAGNIAGTVNYLTARPSKYWTYDVQPMIGDFGASTELATVTGTRGRLGIALEHAVTRRDSNLSGLTYEDQSGFSYQHQAATSGVGEVLSATYRITPRVSLTAFGIAQDSRSASICASFTTLLPCGNGPGGASQQVARFGNVGGSALVGNVQLYASVSGNTGRTAFTYASRSLAGLVVPYFSRSSYSAFTAFLQAGISGKRHRIAFSGDVNSVGTSTTTTYNGTPLSYAQPRQEQLDVSIGDTVKATAKLSLTHAFTYANATGTRGAISVSETAAWAPTKDDTIEANIGVGTGQPGFLPSQLVGDPLSADYDCYNRSIFVGGPQDAPGPQSSTNYGLAWRHTFGSDWLKVQLQRTDGHGQYMTAAVPVAAEPASIFPGGLPAYLSSLQAVWNTPSICGGIPFTTDRIYVHDGIVGLSQVGSSALLSGRINIGRNVFVLPAYTIASVYLTSLDPRLAAPGSFYAIGTQLPNRPLRSASLTLSGLLVHAKLEWFANAQYNGINNQANLPPFTFFNAGLFFQSNHGTMTLVESNVLGTHAGLFSTYQGVHPMPVVGGGTFAYATTPAQPRQWTFTWDIPWTQHIPPPPKPSPTPVASPRTSPSPKP